MDIRRQDRLHGKYTDVGTGDDRESDSDYASMTVLVLILLGPGLVSGVLLAAARIQCHGERRSSEPSTSIEVASGNRFTAHAIPLLTPDPVGRPPG